MRRWPRGGYLPDYAQSGVEARARFCIRESLRNLRGGGSPKPLTRADDPCRNAIAVGLFVTRRSAGLFVPDVARRKGTCDGQYLVSIGAVDRAGVRRRLG